MLLYGTKGNETYLGNTGFTSGVTNQQTWINKIKAAIAAEYSTAPNNISVWYTPDSDTSGSVSRRIMDGDSFNVNWTNNEISGVDFSPEDDKKYIHIAVGKADIKADGVDSTMLDFKVYKKDGQTIDNTYNSTELVEVDTPNGVVKFSVPFSSGMISLVLIKDANLPIGKYTFPAIMKEIAGKFKVLQRVTANFYIELQTPG